MFKKIKYRDGKYYKAYFPGEVDLSKLTEPRDIIPEKLSISDDIDIEFILYRYSCGGLALREARDISLKRLILSKQGVLHNDKVALALVGQINSYIACKEKIKKSKEITIELITEVIKTITNDNSIEIRRHQNWIGGKKISESIYIPPVPEDLESPISELIELTNKIKSKKKKAIFFHNRFISLHPYADGNGRVSRVFLDAFISPEKNSMPLSNYRLTSNTDYGKYLVESRKKNHLLSNDSYWIKAKKWVDRKNKSVIKNYSSARNFILEPLREIYPFLDERKVIKFFAENPISSFHHATKMTGIKFNSDELNNLIKLNVFKAWRLDDNKLIIECVPMMEVFEDLETELFKD